MLGVLGVLGDGIWNLADELFPDAIQAVHRNSCSTSNVSVPLTLTLGVTLRSTALGEMRSQ